MGKLAFRPEGASDDHVVDTDLIADAVGFRYIDRLEFESPRTEAAIKRWVDRREFGDPMAEMQAYYGQQLARSELADIAVRWIDEELGHGVFARSDIPVGTLIGEYTGIVKWRWIWQTKLNEYCYEYPVHYWWTPSPYYIDAEKTGNALRFINHSSQNKLDPAAIIQDDVLHVVFIANQDIAADEQLTYDYGKAFWRRRKPAREL